MERLSNILSSLSHLNLEGKIVEKQPHAFGLGGSCDVHTAWSVEHRKRVAVKQIRTFLKRDPSFAKKLAKEILIWSRLKHENILPFLGYFAEGDEVMPSLVSEWMEKGTLHVYMRSFPRGGILTCAMLRDIAAGHSYLHSNGVIHGDLKTQNILISAFETPLLSDFGLSVALSHSQSTKGTTTALTKGTVRWMAIELLLSVSGDEPSQHCEKTDMWAFGMVIYELLSWEVPYNSIRNDVLVLMAIMNGELPLKPDVPERVDDSRLFDGLWDLACLCWKESISRPTAESVTERLTLRIMDSWMLVRKAVPRFCLTAVLHKTFSDTHRCCAKLVKDDFIFLCEAKITNAVIHSISLRYATGLGSDPPQNSAFEFMVTQSSEERIDLLCRTFLVEDTKEAGEWLSRFRMIGLIVFMEDGILRLFSTPQSGCNHDSVGSNGVGPPDITFKNSNRKKRTSRAQSTSPEPQSSSRALSANTSKSENSSKYRGKKRRKRAGASRVICDDSRVEFGED